VYYSQPASSLAGVGVVEKPEEVKSLLEAGFEYVCQKDNSIFLLKLYTKKATEVFQIAAEHARRSTLLSCS
jgi:hypothetical protein